MAIQIANISAKPLLIGQGASLQGAQIIDCRPLTKDPAAVTVLVDWALYGASPTTPVLIDVDLAILGANNPLDGVRSVYIDNTFSPTPMYVVFPDTQFVVVCPAYSTCISPVWTNGLKCQLLAREFDGFTIPKTTFSFSNVHVNELSVISTAATAPTKGVIISYHVASAVLAISGNLVNSDFGPRVLNGKQFLAFHIFGVSTINTLTANGLACVLVQNNVGATRTALYYVPADLSGTIATVSFTLSASAFVAMDIFAAFNVTNGVAFNAVGSNAGSGSQNLLNPVDGIAIAAATGLGGTQNVVQLAGINDNIISADPGGPNSTAKQRTTGATLAINAPNGNANTSWAAASFF